MSNDPVSIAQSCLYEGTENLFKVFPMAIKRIIKDRLWEGRTDKNGKPFASFEKFALAPLWHGLEIKSMSRLVEYVKEDVEVVKLVEREMSEGSGPGGAHNPNGIGGKSGKTIDCQNDNIILTKDKPKQGTSAEYLLRRLKRDAPEVADDYIEGKYKSVRAAAIAAGIIKVQSPYEMIGKQLAKLNRLELMDLQARITAILQEQ